MATNIIYQLLTSWSGLYCLVIAYFTILTFFARASMLALGSLELVISILNNNNNNINIFLLIR